MFGETQTVKIQKFKKGGWKSNNHEEDKEKEMKKKKKTEGRGNGKQKNIKNGITTKPKT